MKESEKYRQAAIAVIRAAAVDPEEKLEILSALIADIRREEWSEAQKEKVDCR